MSSQQASRALLLRALVVLSVSSAAAAAAAVAVVAAVTINRKRRLAHDEVSSQAKRAVEGGARILLAIDIGSSSVRCSAHLVGSPPLLVPGCAVQIKQAVVRDCGTADADEVVDLVDRAVDRCFSELRLREISHAVVAVGFACFGMNLVGVDGDGKPCTPVYTYANTSKASASASGSAVGGAMKRLREALERTGRGGAGGVEEAQRRTGTTTHVSYAPVQLLQWLEEEEEEEEGRGLGGERWPNVDAQKRRQRQRCVDVWQTLPSLVAARWCRLPSAPVSYSEASWMGMLDLRRLEWDAPTLSVLRDAGFDCSTLPQLADVEELGGSASGLALERWPELEGASIRLGVGDGAAACLGSGCDESSGLICVTVGTSAAARVVVNMGTTAASAEEEEEEEEEEEAEDDSAAVIANALHVPKGLWCYRLDRRRAVLGGSLTDGGSVFEWLRTTLALGAGVDMDAVMREAEEMPPADHGLVILPFFSGERSTGYNDDATACILGLKRSTTRAQLVRAGLESVCLRLAAVVDLMVKAGAGRGGGGSERGDSTVPHSDLTCPSRWRKEHEDNASSVEENPQGSRNPAPTGGGAVRVGENTAEPRPASSASAPRRTQECATAVTGATAAAAAATAVDDVPRSQDATVVTSGHAMAVSPFWQQILADCLGRTVRASGATEETSLGVAVLLSALEVDHASCDVTDGRGEAGGRASWRERCCTGRVSAPNDYSQRAYRDAGLAQKRAYEAIFGAGGASPKREDARP